MTCETFGELAPDLALGLVAGPERSEALAHALSCRSCRADLAALSAVVDELTMLTPRLEPPVDFEGRVVGALTAGPPPGPPGGPVLVGPSSPGRTRWLAAAAVVVALTAGLAGGREIGSRHRSAPTPAATAVEVMHGELSAAGRPVGEVIAYGGSSPWVYLSVDMGHMNGAVQCVLELGGRSVPMGSFGVTDGFGYWSAPLPDPVSSVSAARLVASDGKVMATAVLNPA